MTNEDKQIRYDRMRYTKDTLSSGLVLLAIILDVLYFVSIYETDIGSYYYNWTIGASVVYNLIFLLGAFLSSEGVKNRQNGYMIPLVVLGAMQIARIFYLPAKAAASFVEIAGEKVAVMEPGQYIYVVACLAISGICCIVGAITSTMNNATLARYMRSLDQKPL